MPADRRNKTEYRCAERDAGGSGRRRARCRRDPAAARFGLPRARIVERLGSPSDPGAISLLAIASFDIPTEFPAAAIAEAEAAAPVRPAGRVDLRDLPLVTIDGSDARDFDDAVWAEPDPDPANPRRLASCRRDCRCRLVCPSRQRARPRGRAARQLGLLSRPGRADAARGAVERAMLAEARGRSRLPRR